MNNDFKKGIEGLKKISLTQEERDKILSNLKLHMKFSAPVKTPYFKGIISSISSQMGRRISYVLAAVLVVVLAGGSAAYASEKSLPGDILYPVKVNIVEPIKEALAATPEQKAQVETSLAEERLKEAETLSKEGKLSTSAAENLDNNYKKHKENVLNLANQEKNGGSPSNAPKMEADFNNKINEHSDILNKMNGQLNNAQELKRPEDSVNESSGNNGIRNSTSTRYFNGSEEFKNSGYSRDN